MTASAFTQATRATAAAIALERQRKARIGAIKAAQHQLGLDDDTYRDMLAGLTGGKRSATQLSVDELGRVLDHMRRAGAARPARPPVRRTVNPAPERAPLMHRVVDLLAELGRITGEPHSLAYADAICKRNGWCDRVDFATPDLLHRLVGALSRTLRTKAAAKGQPVRGKFA